MFSQVSKSYSSEAKAEDLSGARNSVAKKKKKMIKTKQYANVRTGTGTTNFVPVKLLTFLSKFLIFLFLFQPPKNFPHVLHYPNLSKIRSEKIFFEQKVFFPKKLFIFFFDFFFLIFFSNFFSVCHNSDNSTTSFCILLTKQTKNTLGQNELDQ